MRKAIPVVASSWVLGAMIVLLSWQPIFVAPTPGLDASWHLALQTAAVERLHWGTDLIFTYGPLGFLRYPLVANTWPAILGALYLVAVRLALATSVVWVARRRFNLPIALVMAFVTVALTWIDTAVPLAFIWCAVAIARDPPPFARRLVLFGGGALSGLELLVKLDEGLLIVSMCAVAAVAMDGRRSRNVLSFTLTLVASLATFWFASGQGVSNVDEFVTSAFQLTHGYSSAMTLAGKDWVPAVALLTWLLALACAWVADDDLPAPRRLGLLLLVLGLGLVAWKEGFVRQDAGHVATFFGWMLAPWIALSWRGRDYWLLPAGFTLVAVLYFAATGFRPQNQFRPIESPQLAVRQLREVLDPARRDRVRNQARFAMAIAYGLDKRTRALLQDRSTDIWPWEAGIAWAYGLKWKPLPMFQTYSAYTSWLDEANARALASPDGPQRILRHANLNAATGEPNAKAGIDGRYAPYDSPAATLALLCHFEALRTTSRYQVLGRVPDRCGPPRLLRLVTARYGQTVRVPRPPGPHDIVFARIHGVAPSGIEALRTTLYRAPPRYVVFNGKVRYRLVPDVAGDGLILDAPAGSDFPRPFALAPGARTLEVNKDSGWLSPQRDLRLDFYAMRVRPR